MLAEAGAGLAPVSLGAGQTVWEPPGRQWAVQGSLDLGQCGRWKTSQDVTDPVVESHREFAKQANGRVWQLLGMADRALSDDDEMVEAAYASLYHWGKVGKEVNRQRGEWLIAHVHTVLGEPGPALRHADACLTLTHDFRDRMADFDLAYAFEGMARALALNGQIEQAEKYLALAEDTAGRISDPETSRSSLGISKAGHGTGSGNPGGGSVFLDGGLAPKAGRRGSRRGCLILRPIIGAYPARIAFPGP